MKRVIKSATNTCGMAAKITSSDEDRVDYGYDDYEWLATKDVQDSDGFLTEYTMYRRRSDGMYVMVFGDRDIYSPEDGDFDYETEDEQDAWDWFDSYTGFDDEDEDLDILSATYTDMDGDTHDYSDWGVEFVEDIDDRSAIVRDSSGRYTRWSKSANRPLSRINKNNEYVPVWYNSIDECYVNSATSLDMIRRKADNDYARHTSKTDLQFDHPVWWSIQLHKHSTLDLFYEKAFHVLAYNYNEAEEAGKIIAEDLGFPEEGVLVQYAYESDVMDYPPAKVVDGIQFYKG